MKSGRRVPMIRVMTTFLSFLPAALTVLTVAVALLLRPTRSHHHHGPRH